MHGPVIYNCHICQALQEAKMVFHTKHKGNHNELYP